MFDFIAEKTRSNVLASLPWVSRCAGLVEPTLATDGGYYPGARPYAGQPCDAGDYLNMSPQETETCIAFVDTDGEVRKQRGTSRFVGFETHFRVVLWYDERKISVDAGNFAFGMQSAIIAGVQATNYNGLGLHLTKAFFDGAQFDPKAIWGRYAINQEKQGLFMLPYRTMAISFRLIGRAIPECFTATINADPAAC